MSITKIFEDEIVKLFEYYPLSLFDEVWMHKKSQSFTTSLNQWILNFTIKILLTLSMEDIFFIVLCGIEKKESTLFLMNVHRVTIFFDDYTNYKKNIKDTEQRCWTTKISSLFNVILD